MENKKLRVCIIGAGFITGTQHIPAINKLKDRLELAGVADCREDALIHLAKTYGIKNIYTDPMEMLDKEKPVRPGAGIWGICISREPWKKPLHKPGTSRETFA